MRRTPLAVLILLAAACRQPAPPPAAPPPRANFIVVAGDSTFWVHSDSQGVRARGSPLQLARYGGKYYEIYIVDDDRSYSDAEIVGQQVWRRDLVSGDSLLIFRDTTIEGIDRWYGREHPEDHPLGPDEDMDAEPHVSATSEIDLLDEFGPYLSYEYRADLAVSGGDEWHRARRAVLDLRHGGDATLATLFGGREARDLARRGAAEFAAARDSVLASRDARAREAAAAIGDFTFDRASFDLLAVGREPAVEFVTPGRGSRGGGIFLPLSPIRVAPPSWWNATADGVPSSENATVSRWAHGGYQVVARESDDGDAVDLALLDRHGHRWPLGKASAPARRIYWLDTPGTDSTTLAALGRAFDEAALYSDEARTAMAPSPRRHRAVTSSLASALRPVAHPSHPGRASVSPVRRGRGAGRPLHPSRSGHPGRTVSRT